MSQWRRIALDAVPSCKRVIEEADNPDVMWIELWHEFGCAYNRPEEAEKQRQIYQFAMQCSKGDKSKALNLASWHFFDSFVGQFVIGNSHVRLDLPRRMSSRDFEFWLGSMEGDHSPEELEDAQKAFTAAQHRKSA